MPSAKILEAKKAEVAAIAERLQGACAGVLVDYKGINVADDTALRKELREAGVEYTVTKNSMIELAIKGTDLEGLSDCLAGTTALATSNDDYVAAARILAKFANTHKDFTIKSGFLDNEVISLDKIDSLAKLPSREVLLATVCNAFNAPIAAFARAVQAIVDKGGEPAAEAAAE
ncbi:MAG: 50S ribosomal protein L10 [Bacteroidaceae bacterium]|nr:50S ribosomal protein L10 [Bacteroidaceae bacterium]